MTKLQRVYGFGGYKESGKDAAVDELEADFGFARTGMSVPIDQDARILNPVITHAPDGRPIHYIEFNDVVCGGDYTLAKQNSEFRGFLKRLGADYARTLDVDFWVKRVRATMEESLSRGVPIALTGTRFPNELDLIRDLGGLLVWVSRPGVEDSSDTHSTESSVGPDDFDTVIVNDGTLEDLYAKVRALHLSTSK